MFTMRIIRTWNKLFNIIKVTKHMGLFEALDRKLLELEICTAAIKVLKISQIF